MADDIVHLDDDNFDSTIASGVVLVDFSAEWCGPCKALAPVLDQVAQDVKGKAVVAKIDIDASQQTTSKFQVTSVPTLVLFKNGQETDRVVGLKGPEDLLAMINAAVE